MQTYKTDFTAASTIQTNEKKEEGENKLNQIDERFMDMAKKILDMDKIYGSRGEDFKQEHVNMNQSETVISGLHSETTESEVIIMLKEMMNEIGMDFGSARLCVLLNQSLMPLFISRTTMKETSSSGRQTC